MSKRQKPPNQKLNSAAERTGRALGKVARSVDTLAARHPHPVDEAREAIAKGRAKVAKTRKAVARKTRKVVKRVRKVVKSVRKSARRTASRLKR